MYNEKSVLFLGPLKWKDNQDNTDNEIRSIIEGDTIYMMIIVGMKGLMGVFSLSSMT